MKNKATPKTKSTAGKIQPLQKIPCPETFTTDKLKFKPNKELIDFATWFSKKYKILKQGVYISEKSKYRINYLNAIKSNNIYVKTPARVETRTGHMDFARLKLINTKKYTPDFVFFLVLWCQAHMLSESNFVADRLALQYYLKLNKSKKDFYFGVLDMFRLAGISNFHHNKKRYEAIDKFINKFEAKK